jgi:hypothetical protein
MAPPKKDVPKTWDIESVLKSRINSQTLKCEFKIKWKGFEQKEDQTWEDFDNFKQFPLLLRNFRIKNSLEILKAAGDPSDDLAEGLPDFAQIPREIMAKFKANADDREMFPEGTERFLRGIAEVVSEQTSCVLWRVKCKRLTRPVFMRKEIAVYYWPEDAALFAAELQQKEQALKHRLEGQEEADAKKLKKE